MIAHANDFRDTNSAKNEINFELRKNHGVRPDQPLTEFAASALLPLYCSIWLDCTPRLVRGKLHCDFVDYCILLALRLSTMGHDGLWSLMDFTLRCSRVSSASAVLFYLCRRTLPTCYPHARRREWYCFCRPSWHLIRCLMIFIFWFTTYCLFCLVVTTLCGYFDIQYDFLRFLWFI